MATQSADQVYAELVAGGFSPSAATTMTAIAGAESSFNDAAVGDVGLENNTWGPSYGLFQVRTLKGQTGTGQNRDINWLSANDMNQVQAAYQISHGGTDFTPWSTYTSGAYQRFLGQAGNAANSGATVPVSTDATATGFFIPAIPGITTAPIFPPTPGDVASGVVSGVLSGTKNILVTGVFVLLGVGLVGLGLTRGVAPKIRQTESQVKDAAKLAVLA